MEATIAKICCQKSGRGLAARSGIGPGGRPASRVALGKPRRSRQHQERGHQFFGFALVLTTARRALLVESRKLGLLEYAEDLGSRRGTATTGPRPLPSPAEVRLSGVLPTTTSAHSGSAKWLSAANPSAIIRGLPMEDLAPLPRGTPFRDRRRSRCSFCRSDM